LKGKLVGDTGTVAWTVVFLNVMRIVNSAILTRLLTAEAFGVVGIITSVAVTFGLLSDIGIAAFMVRHKDSDDPRFIDELWTLRMIRSIVLTLGVAIASGPISAYLGKPELQWAIAAGGLIFLFDAIDSMAFFGALRNQQVKRLNKIDIINQVAGVVLSIVIAFLLRSYWAIMIANLLGQLFRAYMSYSMFPGSGRRWRFSKARATELWSFSRFITGSTMLSLVIGQTDKVALSKLFPLEMFGLYMLASNLAGAPAILASTYASRILYPRFAKTAREAPATIAKHFYDQRLQTTLLYALAVGGVFACAPLIVTLIYDDRYLPAIFYFRVLLVSSFFIMNNFATNEVMIAIGQQKFTLQANIVRLIYLVVGGFIGYQTGGPTGLVIVVGAIEAAAQVFSWYCLFRERILDVRKEALILIAGVGGLVLGYGANLAGLGLLAMWSIG
jgi:O-antigen/teichoic acid export membrane protein